ncbi:MAG TPA: hypothetical protein VFM97_03980 [Gammaproteobacteria bacterium]|nr:hypothetical protein [Gammaproteobacteria bacterium]
MYDSAKTLFRALVRFLHGRDTPFLGQAPAAVERFVHPFMRTLNRLPRRARQRFIALGPLPSAMAPDKFAECHAESLARANIAQLPERTWPAILIGSSNGAGMHLAAALGVPWLPQTTMLPVRTGGIDPDEPQQAIDQLAAPLERFAARNQDALVVHQHDPVHDRLPIAHVAYVRVKWLTLPRVYRDYIDRTLAPGGRLIVLDCRHRRPMTQFGERHWFQFGGLDSATLEEYFDGGARVEDFLERQSAARRRWEPPAPTGAEPEAEWGFHAAIGYSILEAAANKHATVATLTYSHPQQPSPFVAELYRWWYRQRGLPADRLLVDQFLVADPLRTLTIGAAPYWTLFGTQPAYDRLADYLDTAAPWDDIRLTLFSHGLDGIGDASGEQWGEALKRARKSSGFVGVDPDYYPADLRTAAGFHHDLVQLPGRRPPPAPLTVEELDEFSATWPGADNDGGITYRHAGAGGVT